MRPYNNGSGKAVSAALWEVSHKRADRSRCRRVATSRRLKRSARAVAKIQARIELDEYIKECEG